MKSQWLVQNAKVVEQMNHRLTEFELQGAYSEIPLREIIALFNGSLNELRRIDAELEQVAATLNKIQKAKTPLTKVEVKGEAK